MNKKSQVSEETMKILLIIGLIILAFVIVGSQVFTFKNILG